MLGSLSFKDFFFPLITKGVLAAKLVIHDNDKYLSLASHVCSASIFILHDGLLVNREYDFFFSHWELVLVWDNFRSSLEIMSALFSYY